MPHGEGPPASRLVQVRVIDAHGTRAAYQHGCPCDLCRSAEATYRKTLRARQRSGRPSLDTVISPQEAQRRIRQLRIEGVTTRQLAQALGTWRIPGPTCDGLTLRKLVKIRLLHRQVLRGGLK